MKKLNILALSMLLSTSGIIMHAHFEEGYDQEHGLDKKRNDNTYDGSLDACQGQGFEHDKNRGVDDKFDKEHNLNKKRNSDTHPVCNAQCQEEILALEQEPARMPVMIEKEMPLQDLSLEKIMLEEEQAKKEIKKEIKDLKAEIMALEELEAMAEKTRSENIEMNDMDMQDVKVQLD